MPGNFLPDKSHLEVPMQYANLEISEHRKKWKERIRNSQVMQQQHQERNASASAIASEGKSAESTHVSNDAPVVG